MKRVLRTFVSDKKFDIFVTYVFRTGKKAWLPKI